MEGSENEIRMNSLEGSDVNNDDSCLQNIKNFDSVNILRNYNSLQQHRIDQIDKNDMAPNDRVSNVRDNGNDNVDNECRRNDEMKKVS